MSAPGALAHITRADLEPVWMRRDIPLSRIAATLGVSRQALTKRGLVLGLPRRGSNCESRRICGDDEFRRMWLAGVSSAEMARVLGFASRGCVTKRRERLGLPARKRGSGSRTITFAEFVELEIAAAMRAAAPGSSECGRGIQRHHQGVAA